MKSASTISPRKAILKSLNQTRQNSLDLLAEINPSFFCSQAHPEFSPIGWHFGHIAFTEAYWILEQLGKCSPIFTEYQNLFSAEGLPKQERQNLPEMKVIKKYLQTVRTKVLDYLETAPIEQQESLWQWLIQHECQHNETIAIIWQLHLQQPDLRADMISHSLPKSPPTSQSSAQNSVKFAQPVTMQRVEAGEFIIGSNTAKAIDNESPAHKIYLDTYYIDTHPVTCGQYQKFMAMGGYQKDEYWSNAGWQWLQQNLVSQPLYWSNNLDCSNHPVCGVNYYEAEAYARFAHKRLPTEAEWEKAATGSSSHCNHRRQIGHTSPVNAYPGSSKYGCKDMLGNVWEWTSSWFVGYANFSSFPYAGYSEVYFDAQHRVLRGGSWATNSPVLRTSFRNWYYPEIRQIFAGFRCATN